MTLPSILFQNLKYFLNKFAQQPEGSTKVPCVGHTTAAKFYRRRHGLRASHQQTVQRLVSATGVDDGAGHHDNTTSMLTCRRCHGR